MRLTPHCHRLAVAVAAALSLAACSTLPSGAAAGVDVAQGERIIDRAGGRIISCAELAQLIQGADYALLGEQHDEAAHHQRRGALLAQLKAPAAVVAEQLPRGQQVAFGPDLLASLSAAGFEAENWAWPVHRPLFDGAARSGLPLSGGDLSAQQLQDVVRQGTLPQPLKSLVDEAPLAADAQAALDGDLVQAHGGRVQARTLQTMQRAQRARDASLLTALAETRAQPAVLVAGNGHVRLDYGVPQLIHAIQPKARVISVGLVTLGQPLDLASEPYTHVWVVDPHQPADGACGTR